jgi:hypothetical protein
VTISKLDVGSAAYSKQPHPSDDAVETDAGSAAMAASGDGPGEKEEDKVEKIQKEVDRLQITTSPET